MCQLLGVNGSAPTDFSLWLKDFCPRGGRIDKHSHGFGVSLYEGREIRNFHDTLPACQSPIAELLQNTPMSTCNMLAHIRYATQGQVSLENVHPFVRVWKGIPFSFCHNGDCAQFSKAGLLPLLGKTKPTDQWYLPLGGTDSEAVFCAILNALQAEFADDIPTLAGLYQVLSRLCDEIVTMQPDETIFNFLLGCGPYTQFAYSWPGKRPGSSVWNGLHYWIRPCRHNHPQDNDDREVLLQQHRVAVITTKPLTEESGWIEFSKGELILFDHGIPYRTAQCCETSEPALYSTECGVDLSTSLVNHSCRDWTRLFQSNNEAIAEPNAPTAESVLVTATSPAPLPI